MKPAIGPFDPVWGGQEPPLWACLVLVAFALVGMVGGAFLLLRAAPAANRASYYIGAIFSIPAVSLPLWFALFWVVNIFAVMLTLPYAVGTVGLIAWLRVRA
jgi:hypothetical protein